VVVHGEPQVALVAVVLDPQRDDFRNPPDLFDTTYFRIILRFSPKWVTLRCRRSCMASSSVGLATGSPRVRSRAAAVSFSSRS
jgi:hypothetical protein